MKTMKSFSIVGTVMAAVFVLGLGIANANMIPNNTAIGPQIAGYYTWTYVTHLSADQNAFSGPVPVGDPVSNKDTLTGSFFTIYDFAGLKSGSETAPAGWTATEQLVGFTPSNVTPDNDSASIMNITWTYTSGATILGQPSGLDLGNFTADSIYNTSYVTSYTSRALGTFADTIADNVGNTLAPTSTVPEPISLILLGSGLAGAGLYRRLRKPKG